MAAKKKAEKKEEAKEVKPPKGDAFLTFVGKMVTDLRKTVAGLLGDTSRHDDELAVLKQQQKEQKDSLRKLIADPLYSVPDALKKRVDVLEQKHKAEVVKLTSRISELEAKLKERKFKGSLAGSAAEVEDLKLAQKVLTERVDQLALRADDTDTEVAALEESLGVTTPFTAKMVKPEDDGEAAMTQPPAQLTLDEAISKAPALDDSLMSGGQ